MDNKKSEKYFEAKNSEGSAVLCSVDEVDRKKAAGGEIDDENCFEKDVMGRYAANIEIEKNS